MANLKNELESVELYRAFTVEEIQDRREMFSSGKSDPCEDLMYYFCDC